MTKKEKKDLFTQCKQADIDAEYYRRKSGQYSPECQDALAVWTILMSFIENWGLKKSTNIFITRRKYYDQIRKEIPIHAVQGCRHG